MKHFEELAFKAGFTGSDLSNTQFGTPYKKALQNFMELIIEDCVHIVNIWSDETPCSEGYDIMTVSKVKEYFGVE